MEADKENEKESLDMDNLNPVKAGGSSHPYAGNQATNKNRPKLATLNINVNNELKVLPNHGNQTETVSINVVRKNTKMEAIQPSTSSALVSQSELCTIYEEFNNKVTTENMETNQLIEEKNVYSCAEDITLDTQLLENMEESLTMSELLSPMSIEYNPRQSTTPRNDRERFFEISVYQIDILNYCRESEQQYRPKSCYMRLQKDINSSMRKILIDWLAELVQHYQMGTETLYLTVWYIDCFLSRMSVVRTRLQLVGAAALYIAGKYEEIYPLNVGEFVYLSENTYTKEQMLRMEKLILKTLSFNLNTPTTYFFINAFIYACDDISTKVKYLAMYIAELSLLEVELCLDFLPSLKAAGSLALARYISGECIWSKQLERVTKYTLKELKVICLSLCKIHQAASNFQQQAVPDKYKDKEFNEVANIKGINLTCELFDEIVMKYNEIVEGDKEMRF